MTRADFTDSLRTERHERDLDVELDEIAAGLWEQEYEARADRARDEQEWLDTTTDIQPDGTAS